MYYSIGQFDLFNFSNISSLLTNPAVIATGAQFYTQQQQAELAKKKATEEAAFRAQQLESEQYTEAKKLQTQIELERLKAQAQASSQQQAGMFGLSQTKVLVFGGLAAITIMGIIVYKARGKKA